ncbi:hypothetical protein [Spiroplasma endosymbiont of Clivina fossor]|uniref:hypothetical protein n=1 Tax=Spiroplasma endosymbiont of Clivina fossor TaxID=3066282 RepID=UPI00313B0025
MQDFKVRGSNPIIVRIQKQLPEDTKVKAITIKFPRQALFGNIKLIGKVNGVEGYPRLFIENDKVMLPMLSMPIETEPKVRILQQWMSSQVLAWEKAKQFFNEGSVLDLIEVGGGTETRKEVFKNARVTTASVNYSVTERPILTIPGDPPSVWPDPDGNKIMVKDNNYSWFDANPHELPSIPWARWIIWGTTTTEFGDVELEIKNTNKIDSLQKVLLNMLTYTYNYRTNFKHATYDDKNEPVNDAAILKAQIFAGQKPEIVITNLFEDWKFENPKLVNHPSVQVFKQSVIMLSDYIFSELSINMGLNDDYKLLLPYYFVLISVPILEDGVYKFKDVKVILQSRYFKFEDNQIKLIHNDISQNELFKLNDNQYNWLPLISRLEPNDIPSLLPKDIKLSDGNYGKNFVNCAIKKSNVNTIMNLYGKGQEELLSNLLWYKEINILDSITECKFILEDELEKFKRLEISAIFGKGSYNLKLETTEENIFVENIDLFNSELSSYIFFGPVQNSVSR